MFNLTPKPEGEDVSDRMAKVLGQLTELMA